MSTFWMWFIRPFAEILAGLAFLLVICACTGLWLWVAIWRAKRRKAKR